MGCAPSRSVNDDKKGIKANDPNGGNVTSPKKLKSGSSKEIKNLNDFRISHHDLIGEKSGHIYRDYNLISPPLGKGAFGEVRKAVHKNTNIMRAVKIIHKSSTSQDEQERLINEVEILKQLDHPNIIKVFEFYQDEKSFYIVTELCTGGELFDKIISLKNFDEKMAAETMRQVLSAVVYCHKHKIVHRDLKPENLLYESPRENSLIKVIDFGTSRTFDPNTKMSQKFGTPYYIAPEVLKRKYDEKCDVWSCGVILYILLCGYPPFNGANDKIIMEKVSKGQFSFSGEEWGAVTAEAKKLIKRMLEYEPVNRISAEEALNDAWVKRYTGKADIDKPLAVNALTNLKNFRAGRKLQEATWVFIVSFLATKEEKGELLKTFQALDLNNDGQLTREELILGYKRIMNAVDAEEEVERIMKMVDTNNSGAIDYTEWVMATISRQNLLSKQRLEAAFKLFDKDGNGFISTEELKEVLGSNSEISETVWKEIIKEVDDNGDGQISYKEFKEMMLKLI